MKDTPEFLKDAKDLLGENGFVTSNVWYHGTSSALLDSILQQGLKRSGDRELAVAAEKTMATIGNEYQETTEPVYLTPSKELAFYWAQQTVRRRQVRVGGDENPTVLTVTLPEQLNAQVRPDVGAASLLLLKEGEAYMAHLAALYQVQNQGIPDIDLMNADRMEYLQTLGMAYIDTDLDAQYLQLITC